MLVGPGLDGDLPVILENLDIVFVFFDNSAGYVDDHMLWVDGALAEEASEEGRVKADTNGFGGGHNAGSSVNLHTIQGVSLADLMEGGDQQLKNLI